MRRLQRPKHQKYPTTIDLNLIRPRFPNMIRKLLGGLLFIIVSLSLGLSAEKPQKLEEPPIEIPATFAIDETARDQVLQGIKHLNGDGVPKDAGEAGKFFSKAIAQGYKSAEFSEAQISLADMYFRGDTVAKDNAQALSWFRSAGESGHEKAQIILAVIYGSGEWVPKDLPESGRWFRKLAEQGNVHGQHAVGLMYASGEGVPKNSKEAVRWTRMAADQGDADAQFTLGVFYIEGEGISKDIGEAVRLIRESAGKGNSHAQFCLGVFHFNGTVVEKDRAKAIDWAWKAAVNRLEAAQLWIRAAAEEGDSRAQTTVGFAVSIGAAGFQKDYPEAAKWYRRAAEQGSADGQHSLSKLYSSGQGVPKDDIEALAWANLAAASGEAAMVDWRDRIEGILGRESTLLAQQRSRQILHEIGLSKRDGISSQSPKNLPKQSASAEKIKGTGSGAIVSMQGHLLTAAHVISGATTIKVVTSTGARSASVLRIDEANDLAVLKITGSTFAPLPIAPSRKMRLGQVVATIGFPNIEIQGFSPKVTRGEISSLNGIGDDPRAWQISVPVQTGNSGGPLLDENGNLVGVVVSKLGLKAAKLTGDLPQNVNYAVKSAYALALLEPYLGSDPPEPNQNSTKPRFEDMVAKAQQSVVLILVY